MNPSKSSDTTRTFFIDSSDAADRFLASIASTPVVAIDTEGASFHRYVDRIYLLQLSTEERHAILDPLRVESIGGLGRLLESRDVEVVFYDADYDLRLLHQDYGGGPRQSHLRHAHRRPAPRIKAFRLAALLDSYFGVKLDKKHQRADWSMRPLTTDMLDYAAQDTMHLLGLRSRLRDALHQKGRLHWAGGVLPSRGADGRRKISAAFLRLKGARDLTRRELALLRELVLWRDGVAKAVDRSTFRVVTNDVLLAVAPVAAHA